MSVRHGVSVPKRPTNMGDVSVGWIRSRSRLGGEPEQPGRPNEDCFTMQPVWCLTAALPSAAIARSARVQSPCKSSHTHN